MVPLLLLTGHHRAEAVCDMVKDTSGNTSMLCGYFGGSCNTLYYKKNVLEIILAYSVKYVYNAYIC